MSIINPKDLQKKSEDLIKASDVDSSRESETLEDEQYSEEERNLRLRNDYLEQEIELRKDFAYKVYEFLNVWVTVIIIFLFLYGIGVFSKVSKEVVITLLATTSINVIGVFAIIVRNLFPNPGKKEAA